MVVFDQPVPARALVAPAISSAAVASSLTTPASRRAGCGRPELTSSSTTPPRCSRRSAERAYRGAPCGGGGGPRRRGPGRHGAQRDARQIRAGFRLGASRYPRRSSPTPSMTLSSHIDWRPCVLSSIASVSSTVSTLPPVTGHPALLRCHGARHGACRYRLRLPRASGVDRPASRNR